MSKGKVVVATKKKYSFTPKQRSEAETPSHTVTRIEPGDTYRVNGPVLIKIQVTNEDGETVDREFDVLSERIAYIQTDFGVTVPIGFLIVRDVLTGEQIEIPVGARYKVITGRLR